MMVKSALKPIKKPAILLKLPKKFSWMPIFTGMTDLMGMVGLWWLRLAGFMDGAGFMGYGWVMAG